jgi:Tfp pilus assembly protein PilZ
MSNQEPPMGRQSTKILQARYSDGKDFLDDVDPDHGPGGSIHYQTKIPLNINEQVVLEIIFPDLPSRVLLRGRVGSIQTSDPAGAIVNISPEDVEQRTFLEGVARGKIGPTSSVSRRYYRIPLEVPVDWQVMGQGDVVISSTDDVSGGGVQIRTQNPPPVDTDIVLLLSIDENKEKQLRIPGRVAWVRQDDSFSGMGVRFDAESTEEKKKLRDLLRRSMERGRIGVEEV